MGRPRAAHSSQKNQRLNLPGCGYLQGRQGGAGTAPVISAKLTPTVASLLILCGLLPAPAHADRTHGPDSHGIDGPAATAGVSSAEPWCGSRRHPLPPWYRAKPWHYHAVYLVPRDARSRLRRFAGTFQADAFGASALLERLYGRAIRFDMGTPCGPRYLDISHLRLSATRAELRRAAQSANPNALFNLVLAEMTRAGFLLGDRPDYEGPWAETVNYLAWLDGPAPARSCGQATSLLDRRRVPWNRNNLGGKLALVYKRGPGFCGADTVRHEIGHNLGALQPDAPHTRDGVHCTDAREDTMCDGSAPAVTRGARGARFFDYGHDDYWDPPNGRPLKWWTLNLSWFLCTTPSCNR